MSNDDTTVRHRGKSQEPTGDAPKINAQRRSSQPTAYSHAATVHKYYRVSPLDKEATSTDFRGFYNLALLALFASMIRLMLENLVKYGILVKWPSVDVSSTEWKWVVLCLIQMPLYILIAVRIERRAFEWNGKKEDVIQKAQAINIAFCVGIPTLIVWFLIFNPIAGCIALFFPTILSLKLVSYALVNYDLRKEYFGEGTTPSSTETVVVRDVHPDEIPFDPQAVKYPDNLTIGNIMYFWLAPTLCYQPCYPRIAKFRRTFFLKRVFELFMSLFVMYALTEQYYIPTLRNSIAPMKELALGKILERVLKLSITSLILWLLMFYSFFFSFLNATAEVLRFADRNFFQSWWNSRDLSEYWRLWNIPVTTWCKRHIFLPLVKRGIPTAQAQLFVFFVSAVLHELIIGVPTHSLYGLAFFAMMAQLPLIYLTTYIRSMRGKLDSLKDKEETLDTIGNLIFWASFCILGQPIAALGYFYDQQRKLGKV